MAYHIEHSVLYRAGEESSRVFFCRTQRGTMKARLYCRTKWMPLGEDGEHIPVSFVESYQYGASFSVHVARAVFLYLAEEIGEDFVWARHNLMAEEKRVLQSVGYPIIEERNRLLLADGYDLRREAYHMTLDARMNGTDHREELQDVTAGLARLGSRIFTLAPLLLYRVRPYDSRMARLRMKEARAVFETLREMRDGKEIPGIDSEEIPFFTKRCLDVVHRSLDAAEEELAAALGKKNLC